MGEIAEMMLDGTMDPETGEFNFEGEDGPGWPMTGAEAAEYSRVMRGGAAERAPRGCYEGFTRYTLTKKVRAQIEAYGVVQAMDQYHWQVRKDGRVIADWWPHKGKYRIGGSVACGSESDFVRALAGAAS